MRRILIAGVFVVLAAVAGYWLFFRTPAITNYPSDGQDIIAFGDSLVSGTGSSKGHDFVSVLAHEIGQPIVNLGRSGDTTEEALGRLKEFDRYRPKVVLVLLGGNDYLQNVPPEQTFANLSAIIEDLQRRGAIVLLLGVRGGLLIDNFASKFDDLHKKYKTAYVSDVLDGLLGEKEFMYDQVHPNDQGYERIAGRIEPVLRKLLR